MKNVSIAFVFSLVSTMIGFCSDGGLVWVFTSSPIEGIQYTFKVPLTEKDEWEPRIQEAPPLSPGKAMRLAKDYIQKVAPQSKDPVPFPLPSLDEKSRRTTYVSWEVYDVKLLRNVNSIGHEQWIYVVSINKMMKGVGRTMPKPDIQIPVRMDGTIPEPVISKLNLKQSTQRALSETNSLPQSLPSRRSP